MINLSKTDQSLETDFANKMTITNWNHFETKTSDIQLVLSSLTVLQLPMQAVSITPTVVSLNPTHGEVSTI
jgi:hypothetical protein